MFDTAERRERVILIAVDKDGKDDTADENLNELRLLAETAGAEEVGRIIQKREAVHAAHYLGKGKIDEVAALVDETDADAIISDDELSPAQQKNLAKRIGVKILDRTMLILDIFAARALTAEGKAQVELAQNKYRLSHLAGLGVALSRQAGVAAHGGVGNRGPGEKKLELDRRHIRARINQLNRELAEIRENRALLRKKRERLNIPVIALVGYTNAGKSTLMNALTGAGVLAEDKLFATLDTTTRKVQLVRARQSHVEHREHMSTPEHSLEAEHAFSENEKEASSHFFTAPKARCGGNAAGAERGFASRSEGDWGRSPHCDEKRGPEVLFTDTVGFINKLPHHLIQAFRATLEELTFADVLVHVVDSSAPNYREQMRVVDETLAYLKCADKPTIVAMNKCDVCGGDAAPAFHAVSGNINPPTEVCPANSNHPPEREDCDTNLAEGFNWNILHISAKTGEGISSLTGAIEKILLSLRRKMRVLLPYTQGALLSKIYAECTVLSAENREDGTLLEFFATDEILGKTEGYLYER
ncbi:MAG: GTPase HflX [Defluviitaleaceae bacterium]|nr:GTPase HflX [Defluviitaleaceae bacterium]